MNLNKELTQVLCNRSTNPLATKLMTGLSKGRVCRAKWLTKDGMMRQARVRLWSKSGITYYPEVLENPVIHVGKYITCEDIDKKRASGGGNLGWVNVTFEKLIEVKVEGILSSIFF